MKEKELGERNIGFDSLKSRLNRDMQEEGIIARDCLPTARRSLSRDLHRESVTGRRLPRDGRRRGGDRDTEEAADEPPPVEQRRWRWRSVVAVEVRVSHQENTCGVK